MVQATEIPERPLDIIDNPIWELLQKCWSRIPKERPRTLEIYNTFSNLVYDPEAASTLQGGAVVVGLPAKLKLQVLSLKFPPGKSKTRQFYVRFRYGSNGYKTKAANESSGCKWFALHPFPLRHGC